MKRWFIFLSIFFFCIGWFGMDYLRYLNHHNIKLKHPCPQLSRKIPMIQQLDKWFSLTIGIQWYKVKSRVGREYFARVWNLYSRDKGWYRGWGVMDAEKRDRWIPLTEEQFRYLFNSPTDGKGYAFPYDLKEDH